MKINWTVRLKNKTFWLALVPAVLLLIQVVAAVFGIDLKLDALGDKLLAVVNALFAVLTLALRAWRTHRCNQLADARPWRDVVDSKKQ